MQFDNQKTRNVADVVAKILAGESEKQEPKMLEEELKGDQHKIDANKNNKIDAHDFKLLRAKKEVKKEEVEELDEDKYDRMLSSMLKGKSGERLLKKHSDEVKKTKDIESGKTLNKLVKKNPGVLKTHSAAVKRDKKIYGEETEQIDELKKSTLGSYIKKASTNLSNQSFDHGEDEHRQYGDPEDTEREDEMKKRERDIENRQKGINRAATKLSKEQTEEHMTFSEMMAAYKEHGLAVIAEEPTEEEFNKEIKKAQAKSEGKEKADVAAAAVQAVKQEETHTKVQVIDMTDPYNIQKKEIDLEERSLTEPEAKKKEEIVKSMKKKMSGFKERYGERAKNVMYATATKMAKKD